MISRFGMLVSRIFYKTCPDPFVIAIVLSVLTFALALLCGTFAPEHATLTGRCLYLLDAWRGENGFWKLLPFAMQMCLILVTGHALASTRLVRAIELRFAGLPRSTAAGAALVCSVAAITGLLNWGLGLIVGAMLARDVADSLERRCIPAHRPLLAAAGYMGLLVFHGGLSASAPLSSTTPTGAAKVLPPEALQYLGDGVGLDQTLLSPLNLFVTGGLVVLLPILFWLLAPRAHTLTVSTSVPINSRSPRAHAELPPAGQPLVLEHAIGRPARSIPDRLDHAPLIVWLLALPLLAGLILFSVKSAGGWRDLGINEINAGMLALGLILHGSPVNYMRAVEDAARDCAAIIIQFPIYAGIMVLMNASGLIRAIAGGFAGVAGHDTLPLMSFLAATIVGIFVPSGGGQWSVQGPVALHSGAQLGVEPGTMILTIAYGDELANMLQPFWALPLLAITGVKARDVVGYTAVIMLFAGAWMALGLLLF